ncbi:CBU_0592 family membrane protein [Caminibacter sp.]
MIYNIIGIIGVFLIILAYFLLQSRKVTFDSLTYLLLNLFGSIGILISLYKEWNFSAFLIQVFWIIISIYGIFKTLKHRKKS